MTWLQVIWQSYRWHRYLLCHSFVCTTPCACDVTNSLHVSANPNRSCLSNVSDQWRHCLMETFTFLVCTSLSDDFQISISPTTAINIVLTCLTYYSALVNIDIIADWSISIELKPINTRIIATKNVAATKPWRVVRWPWKMPRVLDGLVRVELWGVVADK